MDVSLSDKLNRTDIGMCIRDEEGVSVLAKTISLPILHIVNVGESMGLFYALEWLSDIRFDNVDFTLDSKLTADTFNHPHLDIIEFELIISACSAWSLKTQMSSLIDYKQMR